MTHNQARYLIFTPRHCWQTSHCHRDFPVRGSLSRSNISLVAAVKDSEGLGVSHVIPAFRLIPESGFASRARTLLMQTIMADPARLQVPNSASRSCHQASVLDYFIVIHVGKSCDFALGQLELNGSEFLVKVSQKVQQHINLTLLKRIDEVSQCDVTT